MPQRCTCTDSDLCRHPWSDEAPPDDGKPIGAGTLDWDWRPPRVAPIDGHASQGIVMDQGHTVMYQQAPPIHTTGARFESAPSGTIPREISEARAARLSAEMEALASGRLTPAQERAVRREDDGATPDAQRQRRYRARRA